MTDPLRDHDPRLEEYLQWYEESPDWRGHLCLLVARVRKLERDNERFEAEAEDLRTTNCRLADLHEALTRERDEARAVARQLRHALTACGPLHPTTLRTFDVLPWAQK